MRQYKTKLRHLWRNAKRQEEENEKMARNDDKYFYINLLGIEHGSWLLEKLLKDAEDSQMLDLLPKFVINRLTDYYKMKELQERAQGMPQVLPLPTPDLEPEKVLEKATPLGSRRRRGANTSTPLTSASAPEEQQMDLGDYDEFYNSL